MRLNTKLQTVSQNLTQVKVITYFLLFARNTRPYVKKLLMKEEISGP